jgi:hypothetical protein
MRTDLRTSGILRRVEWQIRADVSGQPMFPIFKGQVFLGPRYQNSADLIYIAEET